MLKYCDKNNNIKIYEKIIDDECKILYYKNDFLYSFLYPDNPMKDSFNLCASCMGLLNHAEKVLIMGFGIGAMACQILAINPQAKIIAVDLDEEVFPLASKFGKLCDDNIDYVCMDAYEYVMNCDDLFDLVVCDVYADGLLPNQFIQEDFLLKIRKILTENGILVFDTNMRANLLLSDATKLDNPEKIIYKKLYSAQFPKIYKNDFGYGGWIYCFVKPIERDTILELLHSLIEKISNKYIHMIACVITIYLREITKYEYGQNLEVKVLGSPCNSNSKNITIAYREFLLKALMKINRLDNNCTSNISCDNIYINVKKISLNYIKRAIKKDGIQHVIKNTHRCNDEAYFAELDLLFLNEEKYDFSHLIQYIMLPHIDICNNVSKYRSNFVRMLFALGKYAKDCVDDFDLQILENKLIN